MEPPIICVRKCSRRHDFVFLVAKSFAIQTLIEERNAPTCGLRSCNAYLEAFCTKTQFPLPSFETVIPTASVIFGGLVTPVKPS